MATVAQHYFDAMTNDAPQFNADLLRRFMSSLRRIIEKAMPQQPEAQPLGVPAAGPAEAAPGAMPIGPGEAPMPAAA
jgi:hypothetical protein